MPGPTMDIMTRSASNPCSKCARLQRENEELRAHVRQLEEQLAEARKDSSTSAKPPSSDIVKPPKPAPDPNAPPRSIGGQPGHTPHFRAPFPPEQVTNTIPHHLSHCPDCGQALEETPLPPRVVQQIDLQPLTFTVEEHHSHTGWCPRCGKTYAAPLPRHVDQGGLHGPPLTALVAYLKGACHASFSTVRKFFRDVLRLPLSRGYLAKVIDK